LRRCNFLRNSHFQFLDPNILNVCWFLYQNAHNQTSNPNPNRFQLWVRVRVPPKIVNIKFHIISVSIQLTWSIFLDFFQNKIIDDRSKDGALWSILCSILPYTLRIKKKQWKISNYWINFFKINLGFCLDIYFVSWCMHWIIAYFYIFDIIYIKDKISETLLHVDANYANWIYSIHFLSIFNHLNSIYFLFF